MNKYKTPFREDEKNIEYGIKKDFQKFNTANRDFGCFDTKETDKDFNGTQDWVRYATDNSSFPPKIQFISKLVLNSLENKNMIGKFYKNLDKREFGQNTIIALKSLSLLHKYML